MNSNFDFDGLYVLDMANNHQGSLEHGLRIIREHGAVARTNGAKVGLKFQFRQLDSFIHPAHKEQSDNKHVPRFLSTRLSIEDYKVLTQAVRDAGMITICTPFDEESVEVIDDLGIEVIKVASCSATDWPLLEKIAEYNHPVIVSTGGLTLDEIDDIVSFLDHRRVRFALMHCVAIYPTPPEQLELNQVQVLRDRHPGKTVGFSTHEDPDALGPAQVAIAKGAQMLERHVGVVTDEIKLNKYSSTPAQVDAWMKTATEARAMCGSVERKPAPETERLSLLSLQRGVFARRNLKAGETLEREDVYFAMPPEDGQLFSGGWKKGIKTTDAITKDGPLLLTQVETPKPSEKRILIHANHEIKSMLNEARIALPTDFRLEYSHHYGVSRFREVGAVLIDCINREYCKKLIIQLPGQRHPNHYHKKKEETFQVLSGKMEVLLEDRRRTLYPGDILVVPQGVWHEFWTETGTIFEEVSTTHFNNDSFYEDKKINAMNRADRKTVVSQWGRYQID